MRAIFLENLVHETLSETHNHSFLENVKSESTESLEVSLFCLYLVIHAIKIFC